MAYSGGRGFLGQGRYVEESRDSKSGSCDSGRKIGVATDVDKMDISERTAGVSSQGEEEMACEDMVDGNAEFMGFNDNKDIDDLKDSLILMTIKLSSESSLNCIVPGAIFIEKTVKLYDHDKTSLWL